MKNKKMLLRKKRELRVRKKLCGSAEVPRFCVVKTNNNIYVQLIDDVNGRVVVALSTCSKNFRGNSPFRRKNKESAKKLGTEVAVMAKEKSIEEVVFDRGKSKYCGILKELADGARSIGLRF